MLIPQGLAFAQIVRVPAVQGLWSGVAAMVAYALFGPSRRLMVGPEAGTAMMVSAVLTGALQKLRPENIFPTVGESIRAYVDRAQANVGQYVDWQRVDESPRPSGGKRDA
jgi:MFS superfamily sulfate permease-like transporter